MSRRSREIPHREAGRARSSAGPRANGARALNPPPIPRTRPAGASHRPNCRTSSSSSPAPRSSPSSASSPLRPASTATCAPRSTAVSATSLSAPRCATCESSASSMSPAAQPEVHLPGTGSPTAVTTSSNPSPGSPAGTATTGGDGQRDRVVADHPAQVLPHLPQGAPADPQGCGHIQRVRAHQHHIGRLDRTVGAGADGDTQVGLRQDWRPPPGRRAADRAPPPPATSPSPSAHRRPRELSDWTGDVVSPRMVAVMCAHVAASSRRPGSRSYPILPSY